MTDPFLTAGVFGHVGLLRVYDPKEGKYVDFGKLSGFSNKFLSIYIFGTPETGISYFLGELEGPIYESGSIVYRGWTNERKFIWEARLEASAIRPNQTLMRINTSCDYKMSMLEKILGKSPFMLAQHLVEDHIVPYVKHYLNTKNEAGITEVTPLKLMEEQGLFSQVLPKITETMKDIEYGVVVIRGDKLNGKMIIKNGSISSIEVSDGNRLLQGENAMLYLVSLPQQVRVVLYTVNLDELISINIEKEISGRKTNIGFNNI